MEAFITAWEGSNSIEEVMTKTGLKRGSVEQRATKYRVGNAEAGLDPIPLKNFPRGGGSRLDVSAGQALLAKLRGVDPSVIQAEAAENAAAAAKRAAEKAAKEATETASA
jgi:ribosomal protein L12E/L44/L45/RPP1/RPP2